MTALRQAFGGAAVVIAANRGVHRRVAALRQGSKLAHC
jgi:hypothetical protein